MIVFFAQIKYEHRELTLNQAYNQLPLATNLRDLSPECSSFLEFDASILATILGPDISIWSREALIDTWLPGLLYQHALDTDLKSETDSSSIDDTEDDSLSD